MFKLVCIATLAISAASASANQAENQSESTPAKAVKEKKICKRTDSSVSRMRKQVCKTAEQWANSAEQGAQHSDLQRAGAR